MKGTLAALAMLVGLSASAAVPTVPEPEFINGQIHLTSDSTFMALPKEQGQFKKHESKMSKFAKIGGAAANIAGSVGLGMMGVGGNVGTVVAGARTASAALSVGSAVGTLDLLDNMVGMDIVFDGKESQYTVPADQPVRIIIRQEDNNTDPLDIMRVVKFKTGKKDRKIRWLNIGSSLLGGDEASKNGYLNFTGQKYGDNSYLITIPQEELQKGEYGIVIGNAANATVIPVATFSVK